MKNLVYYCPNVYCLIIGEIVQDNPQVILTHHGRYVKENNVKELTETVYNNLNEHDKKVVDNWDHNKLIEHANKYKNGTRSLY